MVQYAKESSSPCQVKDRAGVALAISSRLINVVKGRNIHNIEAGLEMIALAMVISSEVGWYNHL